MKSKVVLTTFLFSCLVLLFFTRRWLSFSPAASYVPVVSKEERQLRELRIVREWEARKLLSNISTLLDQLETRLKIATQLDHLEARLISKLNMEMQTHLAQFEMRQYSRFQAQLASFDLRQQTQRKEELSAQSEIIAVRRDNQIDDRFSRLDGFLSSHLPNLISSVLLNNSRHTEAFSTNDVATTVSDSTSESTISSGNESRLQFLIPLLDVPLSCDLIEQRWGTANQFPQQPDPLHWADLLPLCGSSLRGQLYAELVPGFRERFESLSNKTGVISEAYVSFLFGTLTYSVDLAKTAYIAAARFSSRPTLVFVSGELATRFASEFPVALFPRLVAFEMPIPVLHPWFDKLRAILLSPVQIGIIIEADSIITPYADRLFPAVAQHAGAFPLLMQHPDERLPSCEGYSGHRYCVNPIPYPVAKRSMPYGHAHVSWTAKSKSFVLRAYYRCRPDAPMTDRSASEGMCDSDEGTLNFLLWEEGATQSLCLGDPHFSIVSGWERLELDDEYLLLSNFRNRGIVLMILHGNKDVAFAYHMIDRIDALVSNKQPWVVLRNSWLNGSDAELAQVEALDNCVLQERRHNADVDSIRSQISKGPGSQQQDLSSALLSLSNTTNNFAPDPASSINDKSPPPEALNPS